MPGGSSVRHHQNSFVRTWHKVSCSTFLRVCGPIRDDRPMAYQRSKSTVDASSVDSCSVRSIETGANAAHPSGRGKRPKHQSQCQSGLENTFLVHDARMLRCFVAALSEG